MSLDSFLSRIFPQKPPSSPIALNVPLVADSSQDLATDLSALVTLARTLEPVTPIPFTNGTTIRIGRMKSPTRQRKPSTSKHDSKPLEERSLSEAFPGLNANDEIPITFHRPSEIHTISNDSIESLFSADEFVQTCFPVHQIKQGKPVPVPCYQRLLNHSESNQSQDEMRDAAYIKYERASDFDMDAKIEYDMDTQDKAWLDQNNATAPLANQEEVQAVEDLTFEVIMDRLEKEWFELSKDVMNRRRDLLEYPSDINCAVCDEGDCMNCNSIVFCDGCNLAVHQDCYGVPFIPEGQWLCRKCMVSPDHPVSCLLCPSTTGAFKQTATGKWAHSLCALWIPEASVGNTATMEPLILSTIPKSRYKLICYICNDRTGACIQCAHKNCFVAFHATCARSAGVTMDVKVIGKEDDDSSDNGGCEMNAFCHKHSKKVEGVDLALNIQELRDSNRFGTAARGRIISNPNTDHPKRIKPITPLIPNYIVDKVMESIRHVRIPNKKEFVRGVCKYWSLKRKSRRGAPLLKRLHLEPWTAKTPPTEASLNLDLEKYTLLSTLKHPLTNLHSIMEFTKQREKKRLSQLKIMLKYFRQFTQPLLPVLSKCLQEILKADMKRVFWEKVDTEAVSDYLTYVKTPMEFETVQKRVDGGAYSSLDAFEVDVMQIVENAKIYNLPDTFFYKAAIKLEKQVAASIAKSSIVVKGMSLDPLTGFVEGTFDLAMTQLGPIEEVVAPVIPEPPVTTKRKSSSKSSKRKRIRSTASSRVQTRDTSPVSTDTPHFQEYETPLNDTPQYKQLKNPSPHSALQAFDPPFTAQRTTRQNLSITKEMDCDNLTKVDMMLMVFKQKSTVSASTPRKPSKRELARKKKNERVEKRAELKKAGLAALEDEVVDPEELTCTPITPKRSHEKKGGLLEDDAESIPDRQHSERFKKEITRSEPRHSAVPSEGRPTRSTGAIVQGTFVPSRSSSSSPRLPHLKTLSPPNERDVILEGDGWKRRRRGMDD